MRFSATVAVVISLQVLSAPFSPAKSRPWSAVLKTNLVQYAAFAQPLDKDQQARHALDRLTFGPRTGDLAEVERLGIKRWIDQQLHPDKLPENPALEEKLRPFVSTRMGIRETYLQYPPPQLIAQVARGKGTLPDDPELRAIVMRLAERYRVKTQPAEVADPNNDSDLEPAVALTAILSAQQIDILKNGKPEEKKAVLESIPPAKLTDFVYALHKQQRQRLFALAPVELRRRLILSVSPQQVVAEDLIESKLLRAIYSSHQLDELLVDFWFNHFNVYLNKGADRYFVPTYEREAIRPHVLGKFHDLLLATAKSPAMLFYLDNTESVAPNLDADRDKRRPNQRKRGLNENYGRELMELHTLGVDGGYTQKDVIEVARCFTGWTVAPPKKGAGFEYNDKVHDKGKKVVLGHVIKAGGGMDDGLKVLDILAKHPSTAHFISLKLAKRFVADDPPPSLVARMARTFTNTDGDLRKVMQSMLQSPEFWSQGSYQAKVKTPFEMIVSSVRASDAHVESALPLANAIQRLGEPLYRKIEPTGYSSANAEWISSAGLLARMNFAIALAHNNLFGVKVDLDLWKELVASDPMNLARALLMQDPSAQTREAIEKALNDPALQTQLAAGAKIKQPELPSLVAGLVIGSPEFQHR
ncbi:MAG: DUF1800 domain-containing protein [Bryobacteraceae bacterium]